MERHSFEGITEFDCGRGDGEFTATYVYVRHERKYMVAFTIGDHEVIFYLTPHQFEGYVTSCENVALQEG